MGGVFQELLVVSVTGSSLSYNDYDNDNSNSNVSSHLCEDTLKHRPCPHGKKQQSLKGISIPLDRK